MNWFLYDRELCNERVKLRVSMKVIVQAFEEFSKKNRVFLKEIEIRLILNCKRHQPF